MTDNLNETSVPRILFADDDADIRALLDAHFGDYQCEYFVAQDGADAIENIIVEGPDLVVLDVMMPEFNGWEVCRYVRQKAELKDTLVVMLTAIGESMNEMTSPLYGADAHLDKPFDLDDLDTTIRGLLEKKGLRWERVS